MNAQWSFQKRIVADLDNIQELCVSVPTVKHVIDRKTGRTLTAQQALGSDPQRLQELRLESAAHTLKNADFKTPYLCSICHVALRIACSPDGQSFFFKHIIDSNSCPQKNELNYLTRDQIRAAQYNGAKESDDHKLMKMLIRDSLKADSCFSEILEEKTWKSKNTFDIRRPDIQAVFKKNNRIAFEAQLSTTFLDVIVARRNFYLQNNAFVFWIFKDFEIETALMTEMDVFYSNQCNAFIVNKQTRDISVNEKKFYVFCIWAEPMRSGNSITHIIKKNIIPFDRINLDYKNQSAFIYNYRENKTALENENNRESFFIKYKWNLNNDEANLLFKSVFPEFKARKPLTIQTHLTFIAAMLSAKNGFYHGWGFKNNDSVFHHLFDIRPMLLIMYCNGMNAYKNTFKDKQDIIKRRKTEAWNDINANGMNSKYYPAKKLEPILSLLFPEAYSLYHVFCKKYKITAVDY